MQFKLAFLFIPVLACSVKAQSPAVAFTVDDLPYASDTPKPISNEDAKIAIRINKKLLTELSRKKIPATGFVIELNAERIGSDTSKKILEKWTGPGFDLGNHGYSHADANTQSITQFEQEITRGEGMIDLERVARKPIYFRFPYNHTGDTKEKHDAIVAFLTDRGYKLAPCTIDNSDYEFDTAYVIALSRHDNDSATKLREAYIAYSAAEIDWYTKIDKQVFGRDVPHIMLMHDSQLNADTVSRIIALFKERGYRFVTLTEAMKDPAYATPDTYISKFGPMWGYRWAKELDVKVDGRDEPEPPAWVSQYVKDARAARN